MKTSQISATFFGATDTGRVRTNNEDNFIACELWGGSHLLLAAIDGIGGYEGGEVAARIARDVIIEETTSHPGVDCLELLKHAVTKANNAIVEHKKADPDRSRMGCVISSAIIAPDKMRVYMVHVGDSRLYQYTASDGLKKLSHDHSLVGYREEIGMLTEEQAMHHPQRNIIERSLGDELHNPDDPNFLDAGIFPIFEPTQYLFCSDGLSDTLYSAEIASVLATDADARTEVTRLIDMANDAGGKDNITAVIAKVSMPIVNTTRPAGASDDITVFGRPLPPADNSDDMIAPDTASPKAVQNQQPSPAKSAPKKKLTLKQLNAFIVTVAASFIIGGTVGYFIGHYSGRADAEAEFLEAKSIPADSVITEGNQPADTIADPQMVGEQVADSLNRLQASRIMNDTVATDAHAAPAAEAARNAVNNKNNP